MASHGFPPMMAGQFDWETLRAKLNETTSSGADDVALCSRMGINPNAIQLAQVLCNAYAIPQKGKDSIRKAVEDQSIAHSTFHTPDDAKEDVSKLIKILASSEAGLCLLAVCSVLGNYYTDSSIPMIFSELAAESAVPQDLAPSITEWATLEPFYSGLRGPPDFSELVDKYTKLGVETTASDVERPLAHDGPFGVVSFLYCISIIEKGSGLVGEPKAHRSGIVSLAGKDAGWGAAVAEWLFDLKIRLRMGPPSRVPADTVASENLLYSNCAEGEKAQLTMCFAPPGVPVDGVAFVETPLEVKGRV
ncbi:hypothetical protein CONLIGDRAFT_702707 [Coniochaeta ligniaria NRRL 30616]|uniref:Uncharacterized protein n=1 Tax=Coniochaeta ligniaria NRRL 30616 TaxID=1408157 RepID=A0A1J7ISM2_9PEZI|nr:hypothetical protein CONLIGDRAFT_702707 [Coniochaeta ligniaria NRRL 30616]